MRLKLFRATTTADAMTQIRREFGTEALILGTRRVGDGIEVTAAIEAEAEPEPPALVPDPDRNAALRFHAVPEVLHRSLASGPFDHTLARVMTFADVPLVAQAAPVMLVGPPGSGKTLTTVRLATRLVMAGSVPMVITADDQRAGATEQLAAFTRLLRITLLVASHPVALSRALARRQNGAPVLIDTAGYDPFDTTAIEALRSLATVADARIVLVLPAGLDPNEAADLASASADIGATHLIVTRLDCTRRLGGLVAAAAVPRLLLSEVGIGPDAADGLIPATPTYLAQRLAQFSASKG